jgi:hypothetical protein
MLGFVVPVKPKFNSKNWIKDNQLLTRTLKSVCNQRDVNFKVYVIFHDKPDINFIHPNIHYLSFPYKYTSCEHIEDLEDYALKYYERQYAEYMIDKGKKITYACKVAIEDGCKFIMAVDSDDLVSHQLAEFVNAASDKEPGWVIEKGYIYLEGSRFLIKSDFLQGINGSTHIINSNLVPIPNFGEDRLLNFNFFEAHGYVRQRVVELYNVHLKVLPFKGTIYVVHKNNTSGVSSLVNKYQIKTYLKYLMKGRYLCDSIRKQFLLYDI